MADGTSTKTALSIVATTSDRIKDLVIKNGQMAFIRDKGRISFDYDNKRTFYNQITELDTDSERIALSDPTQGYYFVIETAILWYYQDAWKQITSQPEEVIFIGTELPELGQAKSGKLYINKVEKEISIWDEETNSYVVVADKTEGAVDVNTVTKDDIDSLFV